MVVGATADLYGRSAWVSPDPARTPALTVVVGPASAWVRAACWMADPVEARARDERVREERVREERVREDRVRHAEPPAPTRFFKRRVSSSSPICMPTQAV